MEIKPFNESKEDWNLRFRDRQASRSLNTPSQSSEKLNGLAALNTLLDSVENPAPKYSNADSMVEECQTRLSELSDMVQTVAGMVPAYDLRKYSDVRSCHVLLFEKC